MTTYDDAADELYGVSPSEFTATRNAWVRRARDAGDRESARRIGALRKPTQAAWLVNLLWRRRRERFEDLLELGASFREAADRPSAEEIRRFTGRRQRLVSELAGHAAALAEQAGVRPASGTLRDVASTLEAAVADPEAAEACRTGRLTEPLAYAGFGPVDLGGTPALPSTERATPEKRRPPSDERRAVRKWPTEATDEDRRRRREAERRLAKAREDVERTEHELNERDAAVAEASARHDDVKDRIAWLRRELDELERSLPRLERELRAERSRRDRAAAAHDRAKERLRGAERDLRESP